MGFYPGAAGPGGSVHQKLVDTISGQVLTICRYEAPELRARLDIIYTSETFDYIVIHTMGMNSYRDIRFIYKDRDVFAKTSGPICPGSSTAWKTPPV